MNVTITAHTGDQTIEISREVTRLRHAEPGSDQAARLRSFDVALKTAVDDVRRAAGLSADFEPGAILAAWRQIVSLTGCDDPLPLSPASVVDRVACALNDAKHALADARSLNAGLLARVGYVYGRDVLAEPEGTVLRHNDDPHTTMVRLGDEVYLVGTSTVCHPAPEALFRVLHRELATAVLPPDCAAEVSTSGGDGAA